MFRCAVCLVALSWCTIGDVARAGIGCHSFRHWPACRSFSFGYTYGGYRHVYRSPFGCYNYWGPPLGGYVYGPLAYPPVFVDGGDLFGPRAALRFIDLGGPRNRPAAVAVAEARLVAPAADEPAPLAPLAAAPAPRQADPNVGLAWRFVEFGDKHFRNGSYHRALQRYKKAAIASGEFGQAYFRQGLAHLAMGKYDRATQAFRRGLELNPDWPQTGLLLDELYQDDQLKVEHRREILRWLDEHPLDADAHFALGVHRFLNGEREHADAAFRRTLELSGIGDHAKAFLRAGN